MSSRNHRLDRFISQHTGINRRDVRLLVARQEIRVNDHPATQSNQAIGPFDTVSLRDQILQQRQPVYLMLHKPVGVVSATRDAQHQTVIDLLSPEDQAHELHIVGRLDLNSSGLLLLTNDGEWSRRLTAPENKISKHYEVRLGKALTEEYAPAFAAGMHFPYEDIVTQPAQLRALSSHKAEVVLTEGRYHQIKRMFGRFRNPVLALHRTAIGSLQLDPQLPAGASRSLTATELALLQHR